MSNQSEYVVIEREKFADLLGSVGLQFLADEIIKDLHVPFKTIEDFQRNMIENSDRWFPQAYRDEENAVLNNVLGIAGEAGEVAEVLKKWHRGSLSDTYATEQMIEEGVDLMHYLFQLFWILEANIKDVYLRKTEFNEKRFSNVSGKSS